MESVQARIAFVTAPDPELAESLVRTLVEERIVACGNVLSGVTSIYRWEGGIERTGETLIILKTTASAGPRLVRRVAELHPYECPEVLIVPVESGYLPYLEWVASSIVRG